MKKITLAAVITVFAFLASSLVASASLAVYSYKGSTTTIGGNQSLSITHAGTLVIDLETMEAHYIGQFSTGITRNMGQFSIAKRNTLTNYWVSSAFDNTINTQVLGPKGTSYTVLAIVQNPGSRYTGSVLHFESAIGLNSRLTIRNNGTTETAILPRTLSSPSFVITEDSTYDYVAQSSGTYTFNSTATLAHNNSQKTFSAVITELENAYKAKNFTQWAASNLVGMPTPSPTPQIQIPVSTLAGSGNAAYADGQGISASFNSAFGVAVDGSGNVYVADTLNNRIRKITPSGNVTTLAGSGNAAYADGQGTSASFWSPWGVAVDGSGNVYVADTNNNRIRKITPSGNVTTLAGSGNLAYADGQGTSASFSGPISLAVDTSGNVYVGDWLNGRIRKINPSGNVTTFADKINYPDGGRSVNDPFGITVDSGGNVYFCDTNQGNYSGKTRICKITPDGNLTVFAGSGSRGNADGQGTSASFNSPRGVAVDGSGNVYVADTSNNRIRKITPSGNVTTLAWGGNSTYESHGSLNGPSGVAVDGSGNVYVADMSNRIRKITISQ